MSIAIAVAVLVVLIGALAVSTMAGARRRSEAQRRRLAATIDSLGDALIVTEPGSSRIATVNPRATELVPGLPAGAVVDAPDSPLPPLDAALRGEAIINHHGRELAVTAATFGNDADGVVWTVRDMSERARLERAKSEFLAADRVRVGPLASQ